MADKKIRVAIVGLGFGAEFIPIYQRHPNAEMYASMRFTSTRRLSITRRNQSPR
jgi:predicted dehydrogenase